MSEIKIYPVKSKSDLKRFITFAWKIYKGDKNWVPPLIREKLKILDKEKSPFFDHGAADFFIAYRDNAPVGTIAAIRDDNFINHQKSETGYFGFFESINDTEVANTLFSTAEKWNIDQGMKEMIGPMNPSTNDECGLLVKGFDRPPVVMMTYNPEYYIKLYESYGLEKRKDLFAFWARIKDNIPEKIARVAELMKKRGNIQTRGVNLNNFSEELENLKKVYNSAWSENWGFAPMTEKELDLLADGMKDLVIPELIRFAFIDGEPVAFIFTLPDYNEVFIRMNGRLSPMGILKFLWFRKKVKNVRLILLGIKEGHRRKGIDAILYYESLKEAEKYGYEFAEFSWVLEENVLVHRAAEIIGGKVYKTYRIYGKTFDSQK
ncbi:MAG TPA: N-acetyltransferase [Firmicutes bacterium]|nr:N-acetyltransferase [Bacillota bacterium]